MKLRLAVATAVTLRARTAAAATGTAPSNLPVPDLASFRSTPLAEEVIVHGTRSGTWRRRDALTDRVAR